MSSTVFILGAGASKDAGAPLMGEFFKVAEDFLDADRTDGLEDDFILIRKARQALAQVNSKSKLDIHNLESVFTALEAAEFLGKLPGNGLPKIQKTQRSFLNVIARTFELSLKFPIINARTNFGDQLHDVGIPEPYQNFADLVKQLQGLTPPQTVSVITFNYDLACDFAFYKSKIPIDYVTTQVKTAAV
ncbi:MAG TPA: hypothetical protein P5186_29560 [Candidatus Paceibacterota bacterium]|nr:hypothetical protein [Candidatus Paceibacterota bacterium]